MATEATGWYVAELIGGLLLAVLAFFGVRLHRRVDELQAAQSALQESFATKEDFKETTTIILQKLEEHDRKRDAARKEGEENRRNIYEQLNSLNGDLRELQGALRGRGLIGPCAPKNP